MGGVALNFSEWANGPGAGKGRDWSNPTGLYGVAQLSPWLLWPPDGLNLKQGTCGELVGYGYLPLPLTVAQNDHRREKRPDRRQLLDTVSEHRQLQGPGRVLHPLFLVTRVGGGPGLAECSWTPGPPSPIKPLQMETQYVPSVQSADAKGETTLESPHFVPPKPGQAIRWSCTA